MDVTTSHLFLPGFVTHRSACYVVTLAGHRDVLHRMNSGYSWVTPMHSRQQDVLLDILKVYITELISWNSLEVKGLIFSLVFKCKTLSESGVLTPGRPRPVWPVRACAQIHFSPKSLYYLPAVNISWAHFCGFWNSTSWKGRPSVRFL